MHVIGHDAPSQQAVALCVEVEQRRFNERGNRWLLQPACAPAGVEVAVYSLEGIALQTKARESLLRETVGQAESYELHCFR